MQRGLVGSEMCIRDSGKSGLVKIIKFQVVWGEKGSSSTFALDFCLERSPARATLAPYLRKLCHVHFGEFRIKPFWPEIYGHKFLSYFIQHFRLFDFTEFVDIWKFVFPCTLR
eukprot:TRINITY_DN61181_c0_g1_i1.p1 TRINITY_DN61181_c0_g1~~TRINITY_DN61181_c0_g1_i1.p1  ORF type:complete len:113 (+),score=17.11 TRINITY_DN61181_c0_g1_i1:102-440(+)